MLPALKPDGFAVISKPAEPQVIFDTVAAAIGHSHASDPDG
jgi:hypothetical protein